MNLIRSIMSTLTLVLVLAIAVGCQNRRLRHPL